MNASELKPGYYLYGNRGAVWSNEAHIYESGKGNLCGTPALATNWVRINDVKTVGCPKCLEEYNKKK
jgi:hypothetical protein